MKITQAELKQILADHAEWISSVYTKGKQADFAGANLSGAGLGGANLNGADLRGAYLYGADLSRADEMETQGHL